MGRYVNPDNEYFRTLIQSGRYVDKTALVSYMNSVLFSTQDQVVLTRPHRFGRTTACEMLAAYYSAGCDSKDLFAGLSAEKDPEYREHLNSHPVLFLRMQDFITADHIAGEPVVHNICRAVQEDLAKEYPSVVPGRDDDLPEYLCRVADQTGRRFIIIIDDMDLVFHHGKDDPDLRWHYFCFLRLLSRTSLTAHFLDGAFMTGLLPPMRMNTESGLSDYHEYTMVWQNLKEEYLGFTEAEVEEICRKYHVDMKEMKLWYQGYPMRRLGTVYCPYSVLQAAETGTFACHWEADASVKVLEKYLFLDVYRMKDAVEDLMNTGRTEVYRDVFNYDIARINTTDDVLDLLTHLGCLAYDRASHTVSIPNYEVHRYFVKALGQLHSPYRYMVERSDAVLEAIAEMDEETVSAVFELIHSRYSKGRYSDAGILRVAITTAFCNSEDGSYIAWEKLASAEGLAAVLLRPRKDSGVLPALVEMREGGPSENAIAHLEEAYAGLLQKKGYQGDVMLVGVWYDRETGKHACRMERMALASS